MLPPLFITSYGRWSNFKILRLMTNSPTPNATAWPTANLAILMPFYLPVAYSVKRIFVANGGSLIGNFDFGVYSMNGGLVFSTGSIVQAGANTLQFATVNKLLPPGSYLMALAASSTGAFQSITPSANVFRQAGVTQMATAFPLPNVVTNAQFAQTYYPLVGLTLTSSGF